MNFVHFKAMILLRFKRIKDHSWWLKEVCRSFKSFLLQRSLMSFVCGPCESRTHSFPVNTHVLHGTGSAPSFSTWAYFDSTSVIGVLLKSGRRENRGNNRLIHLALCHADASPPPNFLSLSFSNFFFLSISLGCTRPPLSSPTQNAAPHPGPSSMNLLSRSPPASFSLC